jgi:hypothetical protein
MHNKVKDEAAELEFAIVLLSAVEDLSRLSLLTEGNANANLQRETESKTTSTESGGALRISSEVSSL